MGAKRPTRLVTINNIYINNDNLKLKVFIKVILSEFKQQRQIQPFYGGISSQLLLRLRFVSYLNQAIQSLNKGSLEITYTVP